MRPARHSELVVVSNRLPIVIHQDNGGWESKQGDGGLVQALDPVLRERGGVWVGWPGVAADDVQPWQALIEAEGRKRGYRFAPVMLDQALVEGFYAGFANAVLWPLFHNLDRHGGIEPKHWQAYALANQRFAARAHLAGGKGLIWVHDYQLIRVAEEMRSLDPKRQLAFFLHIPFPPLESFLKLPWRDEILGALLAYRLVGFQSDRDKRGFFDCVASMLPDAEVRELTNGDNRSLVEISHRGRVTRVGSFPIGIDYQSLSARAAGVEVTTRLAELRQQIGDRDVVLGVDRLDYTKGIPERLAAFRTLLERAPELRERVVLVQLVVPSREAVHEYQELKLEIEHLISAINGKLGTTSWMPVQYLYRSVDANELCALYRLARVALVTPLRDGMNLVAKEYCACQPEGTGALVLSEFAGAAAQLQAGALLVNPYDVEAIADALHRALTLDSDERRRRMRALRNAVAGEDVFWWTRRFLEACEPEQAERLPQPVFNMR